MTNRHKPQSLLQAFETERLIITPLAPEHQALYTSLYTDAKIMRKIAPPLTLEQAQQCFELALSHNQRIPAKQLTWAIIDKQSKQAIGIEGLTFSNKQPEQAEIGIMLLANYQKNGFAYETLNHHIKYHFIGNDKIELIAKAQISNQVSINLFSKLNFNIIHQNDDVVTLIWSNQL